MSKWNVDVLAKNKHGTSKHKIFKVDAEGFQEAIDTAMEKALDDKEWLTWDHVFNRFIPFRERTMEPVMVKRLYVK